MLGLESVRDGIRRAASSCGRSAGEVSLMAVSKTHPYEAVMEAYAGGQRLFGENRVQELASKFPPPGQRPEGMTVCLIGHLQRNKAAKAVQIADRIDSVDSTGLMDELEKRLAPADRVLDILFEVNSSGEAQKSGFTCEEELMAALEHLSLTPHLRLAGLMTVGPLGGDEGRTRKAFAWTRSLYDRIRALGYDLHVLSMGMSGDYVTAIEEGSTEVRIGTAIFGQRDYGNG